MKKVLSLVLAAVMAFGMSAVAFASDVEGKNLLTFGASSVANNDYVRPGDKVQIIYYVLQDGAGSYYDLTLTAFSREKYTLKKKLSKGGELLKECKLKNVSRVPDGSGGYLTDAAGKEVKGVVMEAEFADPFVSTSDKDFDYTFYLAKSGTKMADTERYLVGTMENEVIEVDEDDEVNLSEGQVAKCITYTKAIQVDTGNGLFINTKMFEDKKYYAKSVQDITAADDEIIGKYPEIDTIYTLYTINMNSAGNTVEFDIDDTYYAYNADGKYIGTTNDKLPMSKKYYLATKKIDMAGVEETPADETPVDLDNSVTGGDDVPANLNDNPGTGANGFVNVAVAMGLVALAAAGAVSLKK